MLPESLAELYETLPPAEPRRIVKKLELPYTLKHASWQNIAVIERSAFDRRLKDLISEDEIRFKDVIAQVH